MSVPRNDRIRIRFTKFGRVRFTSHRDVARVWERSLRRSRLPVAYSEGFSPRPRLRFGLALATAHESWGEYLDVDLTPGALSDGSVPDLDSLAELVTPTLPPGMAVQAVTSVDPGTPSLQEAVESCDWLVEVPNLNPERARDLLVSVLSARELPVTRKRKGREVTDDIRPAVRELRLADPDELPPDADWHPVGTLLRAELGTQPRACRPSELLAGADPELEEGRVVRIHQWTMVDGVRCEPIPLAEQRQRHETLAHTSTAHAQVRAS